MKYCDKSIREICCSNEQILRKIYENMIKTRPRDTVKYRPLTDSKYMRDIFMPHINLSEVFAEYKDGDYAFLTYEKEGPFEKEMIHTLYDFSEVELWFNGEKINMKKTAPNSMDGEVTFKTGANSVIIKVTAKQGAFGVSIRDYVPEIEMAARNYVYNTRQYIINDGFRGQTDIAISRLYRKGEEVPEVTFESIDWIYPIKPPQSNEKYFDFTKRLEVGYTAYAYTCFSGKLILRHTSPIKVFAEGSEIYAAQDGVFEGTFQEETALLIKSRKKGTTWGFTAVSDGVHTLPFADTDDCSDLKWLWIGPFGKENEPLDHPYPPEYKLYFNETYPTACGKKVYWNFYRENTSLYQNMTTTFYGQWFYPMMVGMNGLLVLADKLNIHEVYDYYNSGMKLLVEHRGYACYERAKRGYADYLPSSAKLERLDPIGTIGMNLCEYYLMTADKSAKIVIMVLAEAMMHVVPRLADGTFNRVETMWTDDMYMCLPFLVRLGVITGDSKYFDEIVTQVNGFIKRMYIEDKKIFSHIYYPMEKERNNIPWGRGNGWVFLALSEVLLYIPEDYPGRTRLLEVFQDFAEGVLAYRDKEEGIWHQVLSNPSSYIETSCSAMFITALARGIRLGWLPEKYTEYVIDAWDALTEKCIDVDGNIYGVCQGSGCQKEESYYIELGTIKNDDHGIGIVLGAGVEIMNLLGE